MTMGNFVQVGHIICFVAFRNGDLKEPFDQPAFVETPPSFQLCAVH